MRIIQTWTASEYFKSRGWELSVSVRVDAKTLLAGKSLRRVSDGLTYPILGCERYAKHGHLGNPYLLRDELVAFSFGECSLQEGDEVELVHAFTPRLENR